MIADNVAAVRKRIEEASRRAGRDPSVVKLVVVTKEAGIDEIRQVLEQGVTDIGENRVKDALEKKELLDSHVVTWHMIGHLQSNKVKPALKIFSVIHSVDSIKLAYIIDKEAEEEKKIQIFVEVNVSGEESKFGIKPDELSGFLRETARLKNISILGLMAMAPFTAHAENSRRYFSKLRELRDKHGLKELSMGMTQDFEVAIEEGATVVRVGSAIFSNSKLKT